MTNKPFSHLVWLGAGNACEPAGILATASHITLIEARESACTLLQQQYPQANIINQLLASEKTTAVFHTYNLAEFSAIQPATGLKVLFPGLSLSQTEQLPTCAINETIARLNLEGNNNLLVVDIADSNLALLQTLLQAQQLHTFSAIQLQASNTPLYQDAASQTDVCEFLQQQGYSLANTTGDDPDLPWLQFSLSPLWAELQHEKAQANTLRTALNEKANALTELQKQLQAQSTAAKAEQAGLAQRLSEKETAYNTLNQALAEKSQALAAAQKTLNDAQQQASEQQAQLGREFNEKEQHIKQLSHELNEKANALTEQQKQLQAQSTAAKAEQAGLAQRLSETEAALEKLNQDFAEKVQALAAAQKTLADAQQHVNEQQELSKRLSDKTKEQEQKIAQQTKELETQNNTLTQLQQKLAIKDTDITAAQKERDEQTLLYQKHKDWTETLKNEISTLKKNYAEGERSQSLALKLQAKAQIDLDNLRNHYQNKINDEKKLVDLIKELKLKLQAAANYYHQLQIQNPELIPESNTKLQQKKAINLQENSEPEDVISDSKTQI